MDSYELWDARLATAGEELGFSEGYKILYCPWQTIGNSDTVFLSLNPGRSPPDADLFTLSDERGNSYEVERGTTASPITAQFRALAEMLGKKPDEILTGTVAPFRSDRWHVLPPAQRRAALDIGWKFWSQVFAARRPRRVIACCPEAAQMAVQMLGAEPEIRINSGWGETLLRRYRARDGVIVVQIPHLATFKLFSRQECQAPLRSILDLSCSTPEVRAKRYR